MRLLTYSECVSAVACSSFLSWQTKHFSRRLVSDIHSSSTLFSRSSSICVGRKVGGFRDIRRVAHEHASNTILMQNIASVRTHLLTGSNAKFSTDRQSIHHLQHTFFVMRLGWPSGLPPASQETLNRPCHIWDEQLSQQQRSSTRPGHPSLLTSRELHCHCDKRKSTSTTRRRVRHRTDTQGHRTRTSRKTMATHSDDWCSPP